MSHEEILRVRLRASRYEQLRSLLEHGLTVAGFIIIPLLIWLR